MYIGGSDLKEPEGMILLSGVGEALSEAQLFPAAHCNPLHTCFCGSMVAESCIVVEQAKDRLLNLGASCVGRLCL